MHKILLMKHLYAFIFVLLVIGFVAPSFSQVGIGIETPASSAILDVTSTEKGFLPPRMSTVQRTAISSPATGLIVYDTDEKALFHYDSNAWVKLVDENSVSDLTTGWGDYVDSQYTSASPFIVNTTKMTLPNNASTIRDSQKPEDVTTFYNSANTTITGRDGDGINIVIEFKARPNSANNTRLTISIDIGGAVGEIYKRDFVLTKGNGVEHFYLSSFNVYTLDTWATNGGTVKIVSTASTDIYDIRYIITRTHKAR